MKEKNKQNISTDKKHQKSNKANNMASFESISERNEESSNSTIKNNALQSSNILKQKIINAEVSKDINELNNNLNTSIKKSKRQTIDIDY